MLQATDLQQKVLRACLRNVGVYFLYLPVSKTHCKTHATDRGTFTVVAIKVINPVLHLNAERAQRHFMREMKLHAVVSGLPGVIR